MQEASLSSPLMASNAVRACPVVHASQLARACCRHTHSGMFVRWTDQERASAEGALRERSAPLLWRLVSEGDRLDGDAGLTQDIGVLPLYGSASLCPADPDGPAASGGKRKHAESSPCGGQAVAAAADEHGCVFFVGGSVWALDVGSPIAGGECAGGVYAAVAGHGCGREETPLGERLAGHCAVQIWQVVAPQSGALDAGLCGRLEVDAAQVRSP